MPAARPGRYQALTFSDVREVDRFAEWGKRQHVYFACLHLDIQTLIDYHSVQFLTRSARVIICSSIPLPLFGWWVLHQMGVLASFLIMSDNWANDWPQMESRPYTVFPRKTFCFEFGLMHCDLWWQCIKVRKLFKGGNYLRKYDNLISQQKKIVDIKSCHILDQICPK